MKMQKGCARKNVPDMMLVWFTCIFSSNWDFVRLVDVRWVPSAGIWNVRLVLEKA
jgi:hypothetical protein